MLQKCLRSLVSTKAQSPSTSVLTDFASSKSSIVQSILRVRISSIIQSIVPRLTKCFKTVSKAPFIRRYRALRATFWPILRAFEIFYCPIDSASDIQTWWFKLSLNQCFKTVSKAQFFRKYRALRGVFSLNLWEFANCYCTIEFQLRSVQSSSVPVSSLASSFAISIIKIIIRRIPFFSCGFKISFCLRLYLHN